ncbi:bifunctional 3-(3-hydroxy-phenyl)propionate/3-hydroxycinnamic acid hydroxylase [Pusillimonas sp.]|uniref:bifunctional 3-(3-hydroxy-phenyl)propionate/3-hydroxycinnamic acid hydroxylase n=1 Tax=Pusillimonas sp. TaxID=3040095 RepID=UPI0037CB0410
MSSKDNPVYDVLQVGYGPVSEVLAIALARNGHSVAIFEQWTERYALPRAVCIDHEMFRMLSGLGMRDQLPTVSHPAPPYRWFNADWKELLHIDWSAEAISGGTEVNFVHQPTLECMFDAKVREFPQIDLKLGWKVTATRQTPEYAELEACNTATGETRKARGKYLIGVDGANSIVRQSIGSSQEDRGFEADWLVIDILPHEGVELDIPPAAQYCNPGRPTTIVPAGIKNGRYYRRWEFMRMPGESLDHLESVDTAWKLLEPWVKPEQATIIRHKVYNFRSLVADKWRDGRVLIAGDAAHVMPPFMGQGMCAGFRDNWNLAWKLDLILKGRADDSLLDTYQVERRPHARDLIDLSMYLGKIICISDPEVAAARDHAFIDGTATPPPPFPSLAHGIIHRNSSGEVIAPAGALCPHGTVLYNGQRGRFDDLVGLGFVLVLRNAEAQQTLTEKNLALLHQLNGHVVHMAANEDGPGSVVDLDNKFTPFMDEHGLVAMLVRPDFFMYGGARKPDEIPALLVQLADDLRKHGVAIEPGVVTEGNKAASAH